MLGNNRFSKIGSLIFIGLLNPAIVQCAQVQPTITPPQSIVKASITEPQPMAVKLSALPQPTVGFELSASSGRETVATTNLQVKLSKASSQTITVNYAVNNSIASNTDRGSGKDYTLTNGTLTFNPGVTTKTIPISIVNDSLNEADETINVKLSNPRNALLGAKTLHTYTIIDSDRKIIVDVKKDFGARGNGINDDTTAIQKAIDSTYSKGGGVILFPPGVYIVKSVNLKENITYQGYGATIKRPPMQGKWTKTFSTENLYSGNVDPTKLLVIKGLTFDGNSQQQGSYQKYQLEQAHLIFLSANPNSPKRLKAVVEDCTVKNGVADGISVYTNADVKVYNCQAIDVFRGGFVLTGGYSSVVVDKLTTKSTRDQTGIDIEVDGKGYGGTLKVNVKLENINLIDGDFDIAVLQGSNVVGNNIIADAPFYIYNLNSTMKLSNSTFKIGAANSYENRIVFPGKLTFENCKFIVTRKTTERPYSFFSAANIWWQHSSADTQRNQLVVFNNSSFEVDPNIKSTDKTYAIYSEDDAKVNNNILKINGGSISNKFDFGVFRQQVE